MRPCEKARMCARGVRTGPDSLFHRARALASPTRPMRTRASRAAYGAPEAERNARVCLLLSPRPVLRKKAPFSPTRTGGATVAGMRQPPACTERARSLPGPGRDEPRAAVKPRERLPVAAGALGAPSGPEAPSSRLARPFRAPESPWRPSAAAPMARRAHHRARPPRAGGQEAARVAEECGARGQRGGPGMHGRRLARAHTHAHARRASEEFLDRHHSNGPCTAQKESEPPLRTGARARPVRSRVAQPPLANQYSARREAVEGVTSRAPPPRALSHGQNKSSTCECWPGPLGSRRSRPLTHSSARGRCSPGQNGRAARCVRRADGSSGEGTSLPVRSPLTPRRRRRPLTAMASRARRTTPALPRRAHWPPSRWPRRCRGARDERRASGVERRVRFRFTAFKSFARGTRSTRTRRFARSAHTRRGSRAKRALASARDRSESATVQNVSSRTHTPRRNVRRSDRQGVENTHAPSPTGGGPLLLARSASYVFLGVAARPRPPACRADQSPLARRPSPMGARARRVAPRRPSAARRHRAAWGQVSSSRSMASHRPPLAPHVRFPGPSIFFGAYILFSLRFHARLPVCVRDATRAASTGQTRRPSERRTAGPPPLAPFASRSTSRRVAPPTGGTRGPGRWRLRGSSCAGPLPLRSGPRARDTRDEGCESRHLADSDRVSRQTADAAHKVTQLVPPRQRQGQPITPSIDAVAGSTGSCERAATARLGRRRATPEEGRCALA